jgi:hypothetical protein
MYALQIVDTMGVSKPRKYRFYLANTDDRSYYYIRELGDEYTRSRFRRIK